jgi:eukaryotic-like serine/threonine-protein kinase
MTEPDFSNHKIGQYRLTERLQKRPLTSLYLGQDTKADQPVFVEIMNQSAAEDENLADRFQRRLETVRQLDHPHIAPILQIGRTSPTATTGKNSKAKVPLPPYVYAVIEYLPGPTLAAQIESWRETDSWPDEPALLSLIHGLASALTVAHPVGIFHHDLRPENLIMGENGRLTFIDLGVPVASHPPIEPPDPNKPPKHLDYASPEQLDGKPLSGPSNVYSLGVILYELLASHPPQIPLSEWDIFERSRLPREIPLTEVRSDLTEATHIVVKNCLWRQDWNRYETAVQLVNALETARVAEEQARSDSETTNNLPQIPWPYVGLGILLFFLLAGAIWLLL